MKPFTIKGTISALGQVSVYNEGQAYAWVEIKRDDGQLVRVEKVGLGNPVLSMFGNGYEGEFFFESISDVKRLYGIKLNNGAASYDESNAHVPVGAQEFRKGILLLVVFGIGIFWMILGIYHVVTQDEEGRYRLFYGTDPVEAQRLKRQVPIRI